MDLSALTREQLEEIVRMQDEMIEGACECFTRPVRVRPCGYCEARAKVQAMIEEAEQDSGSVSKMLVKDFQEKYPDIDASKIKPLAQESQRPQGRPMVIPQKSEEAEGE